jgi:hypothetical protein
MTFNIFRYVSDPDLAELQRLDAISATCNRHTPMDDPARQAGEDFCKLALRVMQENGLTPRDLSIVLGAKSDAHVRLKLARRGYLPNPPSQKITRR